MTAITMVDRISGRGRTSLLAISLAISLVTTGCARPSHMTNGQWIGDIRHPGSAERMEVSVDSGGRSARISVPSWQLDKAVASSAPAGSDSLAFTTIVDGDTALFRGTVREGAWIGEAKRGTETTTFELRRLQPLTDREWGAIIGTYSTEDGRLL
ncbi:MAG: hypothetical protein ACRD1B_05500, partial [Thermoanaerobaculia bacterium]